MTWLWQDIERPQDLPQWAYMYLVTKLQVDPNQLAGLRCVQRIDFESGIVRNLIRIFSPEAAEQTVRVKDFTSLDEYPDLILYEGYLEQDSEQVNILRRAALERPGRTTEV